MKKLLFFSISLLCLVQLVQAQVDSTIKRKAYQTWIYPMDKSRMKAGILYEVKDSSLLISNKYRQADYDLGRFKITKVNASSIDIMKVRKKGNAETGLMIGTAVGVLIGGTLTAVLVSSEKKDFDEEVSAFFGVVGSVCLTGLCIGIGAAVGSAKETIHINGNRKQFNMHKSELNDYSLKNNIQLAAKSFTKLPGTVPDTNGNPYHKLALGGQVWMAEDLMVTHYDDGSKISNLIPHERGFGYLYDWNAVKNKAKLCPSGWHVPSLDEWNSMINSLGVYNATQKLVEDFTWKVKEIQWWSSTEADSLNAQSVYFNSETGVVMVTKAAKTQGLRVRCVRD